MYIRLLHLFVARLRRWSRLYNSRGTWYKSDDGFWLAVEHQPAQYLTWLRLVGCRACLCSDSQSKFIVELWHTQIFLLLVLVPVVSLCMYEFMASAVICSQKANIVTVKRQYWLGHSYSQIPVFLLTVTSSFKLFHLSFYIFEGWLIFWEKNQ